MQRTFLITLNIPSSDPSTLAGYAEQITESCSEDGLDVVLVRAWNAPNENSPSPLAPSGGPLATLGADPEPMTYEPDPFDIGLVSGESQRLF
jgi:hypothetical protein